MIKQNFLLPMFIAAFIFIGADAGFAQKQADHPAPDVDGEIWMKSSDLEKKAFLYGAGSALVLEYHLRQKHGQDASRLVKGWVDGLKDMSWSDLSNHVDDYYRQNPDKMQRNVFDVIWHEVIAKNQKN
ncbi:hypothetical protein [Solidesulfovibrio sp.]|uniref:hypothetical protein n=1 Tax=Solidesulfovibrio sp. TaxID=2910990 RepID=UPI002629E10D|nr:hypothetical protein [Solidesulfovibrio sp.]